MSDITQAFEMKDGEAWPCHYFGPDRRIAAPQSTRVLFERPPRRKLTSRERRQRARHGLRGRRGARRIAPTELIYDPPYHGRQVAHYLTDGEHTVALYLPEWAKLTDEHRVAVTRAWRKS